MSCHNGYKFAAKPGTYRGHYYQSQMEIRFAKLLDKYKIAFKPHQKYEVIARDGSTFTYNVDFELKRPYKLVGISGAVTFIEIKGPANKHDIIRMEALMYTTGKNGFVVYNPLLKLWECEGLFWTDADPEGWR